jgi:hypothetical protein
MSLHDTQSDQQDSGAQQLETRCRTPSPDLTAGAAVRRERRLYFLTLALTTFAVLR